MAHHMSGSTVERPAELESEPLDRTHACPRCQGFLVDDWLLDMAQGGGLWATGRRCVNCGHIALTGTLDTRSPARRRAAGDERDCHAVV